MENFKKLLPQVLLLSFVIKMLAVTPGYADAAIIFGLGAVFAVSKYLEHSKQVEDVVSSFTNEITEQRKLLTTKLEEQASVINKQNEVLQVFAVEHSKMKTTMEGIKLKNEWTGQNGIAKKLG